MAEVILMPRLSDTMTEGVIAAWHKKVGDPVKKGELLAEIETDKATMELESYKNGTLLHLGSEKGGKIQVNDLLCIIGQQGEDVSQLLAAGNADKKAEPQKDKIEGANNGGQPDVATPVTKETTSANKAEGEVPTKGAGAQQSNSSVTVDISKMEEVVLMPRLSDTMTEGVISAWHKKVGDEVKKGDVLADIETDKATMELESYKNGKLLHQGAQAGEKIAVNQLLCIIGEEGKVDVAAIVAAGKGGGRSNNESGSSNDDRKNEIEENLKKEGQTKQEENQPETANGKQETVSDSRIKASPLAKKLAQEKGIDLTKVNGSGDNGRITKSDIYNFTPPPAAANNGQPAADPSNIKRGEPQSESYTDENVSQMRKIIAKRLAESKFSAPHFYLTIEITMDKAMEARVQMNEVSDVKISFNDMVVKACAMALRKHPAVNSSWMGEYIRHNHNINIGVAVAVDEGLLVPVIQFADSNTLSQIAAETKTLAGKAQNKKLQPAEFSGNTFTISNLGMMDIEEFTAIINPPDSAIMAVGKIKEIVVAKDGNFGVSNVMKVTLSCDHRSVDGAVGAGFLQTFKKYLENPVTMLV